MQELILVTLASALAGFIDAIAGGGGLILVPALFAAFPNAVPATLLGTNKSASVWGTAWAVRQYLQQVNLRWHSVAPAVVLAAGGSFLGAWVVTGVDIRALRLALPVVLSVVLVYTLLKKDMGRVSGPARPLGEERFLAGVIGLTVGFYDGLFGPGTGSFFVFLFVRVLRYNFLEASAAAKVLNFSTNVAAISLFASKGHVWWALGLTMAVANVAGSTLGTRLALRHGAGFVRGVFIVVCVALILRTAQDAWRLL